MQRQLLNSPADGNSATPVNITNRQAGSNYTPSRQCLSGPDTAANSNQGMQRNMQQSMQRNAPQKDCGCGSKKPANQPPVANLQPMPQRQVPSASQQAKNYQNKMATKYPQQNQ